MNFDIKYLHCEDAAAIIQKSYMNIETIRFFNFKYCSNDNLIDGYVTCIWKIKPKKQQPKNSETNYNPEDLTPLPEGFVDKLP